VCQSQDMCQILVPMGFYYRVQMGWSRKK
jgi:hypothetical protein